MDEVHAQPLVGLALVSLLHVCADAYVSAELPGHAQAAGQHARHLSNVLMRLGASVDTAPELSSDLQALSSFHLPLNAIRPCRRWIRDRGMETSRGSCGWQGCLQEARCSFICSYVFCSL